MSGQATMTDVATCLLCQVERSLADLELLATAEGDRWHECIPGRGCQNHRMTGDMQLTSDNQITAAQTTKVSDVRITATDSVTFMDQGRELWRGDARMFAALMAGMKVETSGQLGRDSWATGRWRLVSEWMEGDPP